MREDRARMVAELASVHAAEMAALLGNGEGSAEGRGKGSGGNGNGWGDETGDSWAARQWHERFLRGGAA